MNGSLKIIVFISMLVLSQGYLKAQLVTDRPDQTESSSTVGKSNLQIESGLLIGYIGEEDFSIRQILAPTTLFRYGITSGIELRLLSQLESVRLQDQTYQGISDMEIGAKIQLFRNEESRFEAAFISHLLVPTGSDELSLETFGTINKIAVSQEINETLGLGYNLGYNYFGTGTGMLTYSAVMGIGINEKAGIYAELYGELVGMEDFFLNFDSGLTCLVRENVQLDFSFGTGLNHSRNYISIGCCCKIEGRKN